MFDLLADEVLAHLASFLEPADRFFLASSRFSTNDVTLQMIISPCNYIWTELDLEAKFGYTITQRFTDEDLALILLTIDAKDTVKSVIFKGCCPLIRGRGFRPLSGSLVVQDLDFTLNKKRIDQGKRNNLMEDDLLPILQTLLNKIPTKDDGSDDDECENNEEGGKEKEASRPNLIVSKRRKATSAIATPFALCLLQFPSEWLKNNKPIFKTFHEKYVTHCQTLPCSQCNNEAYQNEENYDAHEYVCTLCKSYCCCECASDEMSFCHECPARICNDCADEGLKHCQGCDHTFCESCEEVSDCENCGDNYCLRCVEVCSLCESRTCGCTPHTEDQCGFSRCRACREPFEVEDDMGGYAYCRECDPMEWYDGGAPWHNIDDDVDTDDDEFYNYGYDFTSREDHESHGYHSDDDFDGPYLYRIG
uniref:Uncharacterized protein n=1 Tax=Ditylum brightwellii TaxID=49249 RepID=A0A7S4QM16_9STRA